MFKRFVCMILSLVLLVGLIPAMAIPASAASHTTSDSAITILKKLETFSDHCDGDGFIGYGTKCTESGSHGITKETRHKDTAKGECDSKGYYKDGSKCTLTGAHGPVHSIREKEADAALRAALKTLDTAINNFASSKGISLTQGQHDALVLFSFENGTAWTKGSDDLQTAVVNGTTGLDFVEVMVNWKSGDSDIRRRVECNMYLNGKYSSTNPTDDDLDTKKTNSSSDDLVNDYRVKVTVTNAYINVREKASIYAKQVDTVYKGDVLRVTSTENANGYLWGHFMDEDYEHVGYVALMYTNYDEVIAADKYQKEQEAASTPKVMGSATVDVKGYVNVRSGAGTSNPIVSSLRNGTEVDLYEIQYVNGQRWGRTNVGWFSLAYAKDVEITDYGKVNTNDYGYVNYLFTGKLSTSTLYKDDKGFPGTETWTGGAYDVKIGRVIERDGATWAKSSENWQYPWFKLDSNFKLDSATYTTITEVSVRENAGSGETRLQTLEKGTEFDITEITVKEDTVWGFAEASGDLKYDGWINLSTKYVTRKDAKLKDTSADSSDKITLATAKLDVNIRNKANIFSTKVGTLPAGTTVQVLEGPVNGTRTSGWYKLKFTNSSSTDSWARGDNLNIFEGTWDDITYGKTPTSPSGTQAATGQGMVANTYGGVNVRTAPGTANAKVTKLLPGTVVDILEVTYHGTAKWGRIDQGWVSMDYIAMMEYDDLPSSSSTVTSSTQAVYTGHVNGAVEVYKDTKKIDTNKVRTLNKDDAITVYELLTVKEVIEDDGTTSTTTTYYWARINDGYILLTDDVGKVELDPLDEVVYTVTETDLLKVREAAGTSNAREDMDLKKGDQVKVTNVEIVDDQFWGKIEHKDLTDGNGWICLSYCTKGAVSVGSNENSNNAGSDNTTSGGSGANTTPTTMSIGNTGKGTYSGKVIGSANVQEVNVRKEPSTNSTEVTKLRKGTAITITETKLVDGRSWGYCGSGWINLLYVDLTPVGITAIDAKVIAVDNTLVYESSEAGANVVGSYANRAVVNIYEEMNGMYKTDMGWISKGNCL